MASPSSSNRSPRFNPTSELISKIMRPALTSHYAVYLNPAVIQSKKSGADGRISAKTFFENRQALIEDELLTLSCSEASLPGSSLATHEINNDFTGVTERHAYRRQYDDRIDFTFYVDHDHKIIKFFETWMSWIVGEDQFVQQSNSNYSYRVKFPEEYRSDIYIQKFEKDLTTYSEYTFIGAYPISINSMPVSYDSSQLLKCTVSFSYIRYFMSNLKYNVNYLVDLQLRTEEQLRNNLPPGTTFPEGGINLEEIIRNNPPAQRLPVFPFPGTGFPFIP